MASKPANVAAAQAFSRLSLSFARSAKKTTKCPPRKSAQTMSDQSFRHKRASRARTRHCSLPTGCAGNRAQLCRYRGRHFRPGKLRIGRCTLNAAWRIVRGGLLRVHSQKFCTGYSKTRRWRAFAEDPELRLRRGKRGPAHCPDSCARSMCRITSTMQADLPPGIYLFGLTPRPVPVREIEMTPATFDIALGKP
jgi:hypothetical protein